MNGGEVRVHIKDDQPAFEIIPAAPKPKRGKKKVAALPAPTEGEG